MKAFNNSPLPKGDLNNQELKTKGTIWKPLITVSLLSVFSFTAGQYLPYVIVAVSGSGAIAAVPLAIFAVSTAVALTSTIYLIRLAVSRADNKKEEPQKFVCENCTNRKSELIGKEPNKTVKQDSESQKEVGDLEHVNINQPTPQQPSLTLGTAIPQNNNAPPPPPPFGAPPPPPPPPPLLQDAAPKKAGGPENDNSRSALLEQIREGVKLKTTNDGTTQENTSPCKKFIPPKDPRQASVDLNELHNKLKSRRKGISGKQEDDVESTDLLKKALNKISAMIPPPPPSSKSSDTESDDEDHTPNSEWEDECSTTSTLQSDHRERSESPDSGHGSDGKGSRPHLRHILCQRQISH